MAFAEDLSVFFDTADFAVAATLQGGATVNVIQDEAFLRAVDRVSSTDPACLARASDVGADKVGQTLTIGATVYTIRERQPIDDGAVVLLELEAP